MKLAKKNLILLLAAMLLPTTGSAVTTLRYIDHEPLMGMRTRFINDIFFPEIEKESKGRLKIEPHWNGEIAKSYDELTVAGNGTLADMAVIVPEYTPKALPLHQLFKSFPVGPRSYEQVAFFRRVYADVPAFSEELQKSNVVNVFSATGFPVAFFSTQPIKSLEEIKGKKWRTASFWHQDFLKNAGAVPVSMPWNDGIYNALKAGTLDGVMVNVDSGYDFNLHKISPNVLISENLWLGHLYLLVINKPTWDKLATEDKDAVKRAALTSYAKLGAFMDKSIHNQINALEKEGATVRLLTKDDIEKWNTTTRYQEIQKSWIKEQESKGVENISQTLENITAIMNETKM